jgi:cytochrome b involved in lipid metabolism
MTPAIKREFILGTISIVILLILSVFHAFRYEQNKSHLSTNLSIPTVVAGITLTTDEIAKHTSPEDCWLLIEKKVYSASDFLVRHPGGGGLILPYCGQDATEPFMTQGGRGSHSQEAMRILGLLYVGDMNGKVTQLPDPQTIQSISVQEEDDD